MLLCFEDASALCHDYQHLVGNHVQKGRRNIATITAVVIAPYDELSKYRFLERYKRNNRVENSLSFYNGLLYDILVIARPLQGHDLLVYELHKFLVEYTCENHQAFA